MNTHETEYPQLSVKTGRWQTQYDKFPDWGETVFGPSMAVPDMSMTIGEILLRHATGRQIPVNAFKHYGGDTLYPNMQQISEMDQIDLVREHAAHVQKLEDDLKNLTAKRKQAIKQARANLNALKAESEADQLKSRKSKPGAEEAAEQKAL